VSTKILSVASKPFAAMFDGRFLEGQKLSTKSPPEVEFPKDDASAFQSFCELPHHREARAFATEDSTRMLLDLTVVAAKYDAMAAVKWFLQTLASERICTILRWTL